jgi:hypothetical protein
LLISFFDQEKNSLNFEMEKHKKQSKRHRSRSPSSTDSSSTERRKRRKDKKKSKRKKKELSEMSITDRWGGMNILHKYIKKDAVSYETRTCILRTPSFALG